MTADCVASDAVEGEHYKAHEGGPRKNPIDTVKQDLKGNCHVLGGSTRAERCVDGVDRRRCVFDTR